MSFREEAQREQFDHNKKTFISILPVGSKWALVFFASVISLLAISLFTIKIPIRVNGSGIITSGNEAISIKSSKPNHSIEKIYVSQGDIVKKGQPLFSIAPSNRTFATEQISLLNKQLLLNRDLKNISQNKLNENDEIHNQLIRAQENITSNINRHAEKLKKFEEEALNNYKKGLSSKKEWELKYSNLASANTELEHSQISKVEITRQHQEKKISYLEDIYRLDIQHIQILQQISEHSESVQTSPCDCTISQIFVQEGSTTDNSKVVMILSLKSELQKADVFINSDSYIPIPLGNEVVIKTNAYPSLKFGTIKGIVEKTYPVTVSGVEHPHLFDTKEHYFQISVKITDIPPLVNLQNGMRFEAQVILRHQTIAQFIFE